TKDVVIELLLPERRMRLIRELEGGPAFEGSYEEQEIGGGIEPFREQVQMVWHEAIRADGKPIFPPTKLEANPSVLRQADRRRSRADDNAHTELRSRLGDQCSWRVRVGCSCGI